MANFPEGWINRIDNGSHKYVNIVPAAGKEPKITYFDNRVIYLPSEQEKYEADCLRRGEDIIWLGVTGWTKPPKHYPNLYGTSSEPGVFESLVLALIMESALALKKEGISVDLRHGVSNAGVDAAAIQAMERLKLTGSGVNCPLFMPWVVDDTKGGPVLVAQDQETYHKLFSKYHQILIVTGGRDAAFYHDYLNRLKGDGYSIVANVMQVVSKEIIPGVDKAPDQDKPTMNNAAAYIREKNSFTYSPVPRSFDELIVSTKLTLLDNAYRLLKKQPNVSLLNSLEEESMEYRKANQKQEPHLVTKAELDERIVRIEREFLG
jgi:hypothetical protein